MERLINVHKLIQWAEDTVTVYKRQQINLGYYTQTPLTPFVKSQKSPDLLILGINPGYARETENITGNVLLKGNPCFKNLSDKEILFELSEKYDKEKRRYGWNLWKKLHKLLDCSQKGEILLDLDRFVISNMVFFGTANEGEIPKEIDQELCAKQTLDLIDILNPKVVLLLGVKSKSLFETISKTKMIELDAKNLSHCKRGDSIVFAIKHTSRFYSNAKLNEIGPIICSALDSSKAFEEAINIVPLMQLINSQDSIQRIDSNGNIVYTYWCNKDGKYKEENGTISIGLGYDKDKNYILSILAKGNHPEKLLVSLDKYCNINGLFKRYDCDNTRFIANAKANMTEVANDIDGLLSEIKKYREEDFPQ